MTLITPIFYTDLVPRTDRSATRLVARIQQDVLPKLHTLVDRLDRIDVDNHDPDIVSVKAALRDLIPEISIVRSRAVERFESRVEQRGIHMIWTGGGREGPDGAPICDWNGKRTTAARVMWMLHHGRSLDPGQRLRKLTVCPFPRCISPDCHRTALSIPGRVTGKRYDMNGRRVCNNIEEPHVLRDPNKDYCSICYELKRGKYRKILTGDDPRRTGRVTRPILTAPSSLPETDGVILTRHKEELEERSQEQDRQGYPDRSPASKVPTPDDLAAMFEAGKNL